MNETPTDALERLKAVAKAAATLVAKLDLVHHDSQYQSVWTLFESRCGNPGYNGPTYDVEFLALRDVLAVLDAAEAMEKPTIAEALRASHKAGGNAWDKIKDPQAFMGR